MKTQIKIDNKRHKISNLNEEWIGPGPLLLPEEEEFGHDHILYGEDAWSLTILKDGKLADMSKTRGPTNIEKPNHLFTSWNYEIYKCLKYLDEY